MVHLSPPPRLPARPPGPANGFDSHADQEQIRLLEGVCDKIEGRLGGAGVSINQLHRSIDRLLSEAIKFIYRN